MHSFQELTIKFGEHFAKEHFPEKPKKLYDAASHILKIGGKRIRPILALMGNELFDTIHPDAYQVGTAVELFHNFTLVHDDLMDKAPLRRNQPTVHTLYGDTAAILAGDVMLINVYEYLNKVQPQHKQKLLAAFNKAAIEVCEGQQMDMDFEETEAEHVQYDDYVNMIALKTSVLLAASLKMGAIIGGGSEYNQEHLYQFGKNVGIAFQIQDDFLDAFGDPEKFGKQQGGDILVNKKTFLLLKALELCDGPQKAKLKELLVSNPEDKVAQVLELFHDCQVDQWAEKEKERFHDLALVHLEKIAVLSARKQPLIELADFLLKREH
ncbi:polyprenyl synthetase family protein [Chitinophaga sancti]|uniref:Geranylgeranyl diphosphate synthase, type II n=1 Tax=Chitinophaga sancti TaxID=1004 RepID=A0A1K1SB54_9BACT|nr:polyprenyl synthetase family protein [Chitinophaga sancti]WQD63522.1 polyprenyl synthetase family protein [Chitinophaga sancti]WQG90852.1 polyprenyl synthetase family protein [Chitinophaga sancti]SFW81534.1 geranylgeranyl diphosphate synthase, type II [Chitinophaga sancti]